MKKIWTLGGALAFAAALAAPSGAATAGASGDTCSANGTGTQYAVVVTVPSNASEQGAFAFGAPGNKIVSIKATGNPGKLSTASLPANTTVMWTLTNPSTAVPGSQVTATVTTTRSISGSFTVVPAAANTSTPSYFDPILCAVTRSTVPSTAFTVHGPFQYNASKVVWQSFVTVAGPGKVSVSAKSSPKSLIHSQTYIAYGSGKVKVALTPTAAGKARLASTGSLKVRVVVEFSPKNGKPLNKFLTLTLKR